MADMHIDIYEWLREKQTVRSPSGMSYEVTRLRSAADEIERWRHVSDRLYQALCTMMERRCVHVDDADLVYGSITDYMTVRQRK